jgi:hypothetical protein
MLRALRIEATDAGSAIVRQIPWTVRCPEQVFDAWYPREKVEQDERRRWQTSLMKHGLHVIEDVDKHGHFLRVTPPIL